MAKKINYLNNKDLLLEVHKSKSSYCEFSLPNFHQFDLILENKDDLVKLPGFCPDAIYNHETGEAEVLPIDDLDMEIEIADTFNIRDYMAQHENVAYDIFDIPSPRMVEIPTVDGEDTEWVEVQDDPPIVVAQKAQAKRLSKAVFLEVLAEWEQNPDGAKKPRQIDYNIDFKTIPLADLVFRIVTYEHIPLDFTRKRKKKKTADFHAKLNFIPFKHYIITNFEDETISEVGSSHTFNGEFSDDHGAMTNKLAHMFKLLVDRYGQRSNWRAYSYLDEMKGQALLQLSQMGLQFNEARSDNPFSYYTQTLSNSFTRVLNGEKRHQDLRDDLLEQQGKTPSFTRQLANDEDIEMLRAEAAESPE